MSALHGQALTDHELWLLDIMAYINFDYEESEHRTLGDLIDDLQDNNYELLFSSNNARVYYENGWIERPNQDTMSLVDGYYYPEYGKVQDFWGETFTASGALTRDQAIAALNTIADNEKLMNLELLEVETFDSANDDVGYGGRGSRVLTFYNSDSEEIAFAFRGTGPGQWPDNWHSISDVSSQQQEEARDYIDEILKSYNGRYIISSATFTGHSKGGNTATFSALELGLAWMEEYEIAVRCIPFDSQGPSRAYLSLDDNQAKIDYYLANPSNYQINLQNDFVNVLAGLLFNKDTGQITGFGTQYWLENPGLSTIDWQQHAIASMCGIIDPSNFFTGTNKRYQNLRFENQFVGVGADGGYPENSSPGYIGYLAAAITGKFIDLSESSLKSDRDYARTMAYGIMSLLGVDSENEDWLVIGDGEYMGAEEFLAYLAEGDNLDRTLLLFAEAIQETHAVALAKGEEAEFWESLNIMSVHVIFGIFDVSSTIDKYLAIIARILLEIDVDHPPEELRYHIFREMYPETGGFVKWGLRIGSQHVDVMQDLFDWAGMEDRYWQEYWQHEFSEGSWAGYMEEYGHLPGNAEQYEALTGIPWTGTSSTAQGAAAAPISTGVSSLAAAIAQSCVAASTVYAGVSSTSVTPLGGSPANRSTTGPTLSVNSNTVAGIIADLKTTDRRLGTLEGNIISLRSSVNAELDRLDRKRSTGEVRAERRELNAIKTACDDALRDLSGLPLLQMANIIENNVQSLFDLDAGHSRQASVIRM